jgi:hypothetical protein
MPKTTKSGRPIEPELPDTLKRSPAKAQRQFAKTHDAAAEQYGEGERAHRTAFASLKHNFEKVGDHWEPKDEPGPSDPRSKKTTAQKRRGTRSRTSTSARSGSASRAARGCRSASLRARSLVSRARGRIQPACCPSSVIW